MSENTAGAGVGGRRRLVRLDPELHRSAEELARELGFRDLSVLVADVLEVLITMDPDDLAARLGPAPHRQQDVIALGALAS